MIDIGAEHSFTAGVPGKRLAVRADIVNLLDHSYQIRNGSGLGISAAQYGQRRGFLFGIGDPIQDMLWGAGRHTQNALFAFSNRL